MSWGYPFSWDDELIWIDEFVDWGVIKKFINICYPNVHIKLVSWQYQFLQHSGIPGGKKIHVFQSVQSVFFCEHLWASHLTTSTWVVAWLFRKLQRAPGHHLSGSEVDVLPVHCYSNCLKLSRWAAGIDMGWPSGTEGGCIFQKQASHIPCGKPCSKE
jgi:hypothetical protein